MRIIAIVIGAVMLGSCQIVKSPEAAEASQHREGVLADPPRYSDYLVDGDLPKDAAAEYISHLKDYSEYLMMYANYLADRNGIVSGVDPDICYPQLDQSLIELPTLELTVSDPSIVVSQLTSHIELINYLVDTHNRNVISRAERFQIECISE